MTKELLLTHENRFFPNLNSWQEFADGALTSLLQRKNKTESLRIWVPICAAGVDAYSIAMLVMERRQHIHQHGLVQIFASDTNQNGLRFARRGIYPADMKSDDSSGVLDRFFVTADDTGQFRVSDEVREIIIFAEQDLVCDPPFEKLDLICCRNVLKNLSQQLQTTILAQFHFALNEDGILFLGDFQSSSVDTDQFIAISRQCGIYRRVNATVDDRNHRGRRNSPQNGQRVSATSGDFVDAAPQAYRSHLLPSAVLVNRLFQFSFVCGDIDDFFIRSLGGSTDDIFSNARSELLPNLRMAFHQALEKNRTATFQCSIRRANQTSLVRVSIHPLRKRTNNDELALIVFEPCEQADHSVESTTGAKASSTSTAREYVDRDHHVIHHRDKQEFENADEYLSHSIDQLNLVQRHLKPADEELSSLEKALRSTNDELHDFKFELQLLNEELTAANNRLEVELVKRVQHFELLRDVAITANQSRTIDEAILDALQRISHFNRSILGHYHLRDHETNSVLAPSSVWHILDGLMENEESQIQVEEFQFATIEIPQQIGHGWIGRAFEIGGPSFVSNLDEFSPQQARYAAQLGIISATAFPVFINQEVVATIEFYSCEAPLCENSFLELMHNVGIQLGHVIERKRLEHAVALATHEQQRHFGRELHDNIAQQLTGLNMMAHALREKLERMDRAPVEEMSLLVSHLSRTHEQVRQLSRGLMPVEVDGDGLVHALKELMKRSEEMYQVECDFQSSESIDLPEVERRTHLYRIAQEAIHNAIKHGQATKLVMTLKEDSDHVIFSLRDNGCGFDTEGPRKRGAGLRIMHYRADLISAGLAIESKPGFGTLMKCVLLKNKSSKGSQTN